MTGRRPATRPRAQRVVAVELEARLPGLSQVAAVPEPASSRQEGRNRQIRRMFEQVGHHVEKIKRVQLGPLVLDVEPGKFRELTNGEVEKLKSAAEGSKEGM